MTGGSAPAPTGDIAAAGRIPRHIAIVMDGNGRWAKARNLPRTEGHARGEDALFDVIEGAVRMHVFAAPHLAEKVLESADEQLEDYGN